MGGDFDVFITANSPVLKQIVGNPQSTNFYTDELEFFNAQYMTEAEKFHQKTQHGVLSSIPFVNFREIDNIIKEVYAAKGKEPTIDLFPRWVAMTTIYN